MQHAYLGVHYDDDAVAAAASKGLVRAQATRTSCSDICSRTASLLAEGHVFGWFQGRSEFGPRALGNRSILADPRRAEMKDKVNMRVKHRQAFRPFAPIRPARAGARNFRLRQKSPFMLLTQHVRPEWRDGIPAIVHVDGTARVQTLRQEHNPRLYRLLKEFEAITGVPVLLNTSFNIKGEPIVETPADAIKCFLGTGMDYLVLHDTLLAKKPLHLVLSPMARAYSEVSSLVRVAMTADVHH